MVEWIQISKHRFYSMESVGTIKYILVVDLKTPYKAPWKSQMAFEAEMWGDFVTFRAKNHSEDSCFLSELCLEMRGIPDLESPDKAQTEHSIPGVKGALNYLN